MSQFTDRRAAAPHPGPIVKRQFLDPLGISPAALADQIGMEAEKLTAMLEGRASIDVDTAVRLARSLQLPGERVMQMQNRFDFAAARAVPSLQTLAVLRPVSPPPFPEAGYLTGHLGHAADDAAGDGSLFFQEDLPRLIPGDEYAGLHALWQGDRLRIYGTDDEPVWIGPILQNLDGRMLLPYVRVTEWQPWFAGGFRADLAIGAEHAAFFERMRNA
jgi:addiction module HigA family antidote